MDRLTDLERSSRLTRDVAVYSLFGYQHIEFSGFTVCSYLRFNPFQRPT